MIPDQKHYSVNKNMLLIVLGLEKERYRELREIISRYYTIRDAKDEDEVLSLLGVNLGKVIAVMFGAEMILNENFSLIRRICEDTRFVMIPIIAAGYEHDEQLCGKCLSGGVNEYFSPPYREMEIPLRLNNAARSKDAVTFHEMEMMLKELPSNIYLKDANGRYIFSAHYWHHLKANEPGWTIRGKSEFDIQNDPEIAQKAYEADLKMIAEKKPSSYILELNTNGIREFIQVDKSPTYDPNGNVSGIIAIMTDVTELEMLKRNLENRTEAIAAELRVAAEIQSNMLPTDFAEHDKYVLNASMIPAKNVGGDFYDFFPIDEEHLGLIIADVSGKGVPAALFMAISKMVIHDRALAGGTPSEILEFSNRHISENNKMGLFVTVWFGILDIKTGIVTYANAGHEYPAVKAGDGEYSFLETDNFPPIGAMDDTEYEDNTTELGESGYIFLYTDGVTDIRNSEGVRFGQKRMLKLLNEMQDASPEDIIKRTNKCIDEFLGEAERFDDTTMMSIKFKK